MLLDGLQLIGSSTALNLTVDGGVSLPTSGNYQGELFFLVGSGLHVFDGTSWLPVGKEVTNSAIATALGYTPAALDESGKLSAAQLPAIAITDTSVVSSQAAMLALTAEVGDVAVRTDNNKTYILKAAPAAMLENWVELAATTATLATLTSTQIGYGSASNTLTGTADLTYDSANRILTVGAPNDSSGFTIRTPASASATAPPALTLSAGNSTGTAQGGNLSIYSGSSDAGNGGNIDIRAGYASANGRSAGHVGLQGGNALSNASGAGGTAYVYGGAATSPNAAGGTATLAGGASSSTQAGGQAEVFGGNNSSSGPGGNVLLRAGNSGSGTGGSIVLNTYASGGINTERLRITSTGAWGLGGASNYGTAGQVLTSNGNAPPTWSSPGSSNASNLSGGSTGDIPFQSATNTTSFASFGSLRFVAASSRLELGDQNTTAGQLHLKGAAGQTPRISTGTDDVVAYVDLLIKPARPSSGGGGLVTVSGGDTNSGTAPAGGVTIVGGGASSTGAGTGLFGPNGPVLISGGPGHGSYPHGGGVTISGGSGNYAAGWVTIQGGTGTGSNGGGGIIFNTAATTTLTERLRITNTGAWHLAGSPGTAGQVLRSNGDAPPTWTTPSAGATLNATQIGYGSAGNALTGSADLTYDSANRTLTVGGLNDSSGFTIRTPGSASGTAPPSLTLQAGHSTGTAQGGNLSIYSGSSDAGNGGHAGIQGGTASTEGKYAGNATLVGGSAATNASGAGQAYISGGSSSSPNAGGGTATLTGGTSSSTLTGGQAEVTGGNNTSSGPGGNVLLRAGYSIGGTGGSIILNTYASGGVNTERLRITSTGAWALAGATNYGTSGQVLTSNGNAAPSWAPAPAPTLASTHLAIGSGSNTITSTVKLRWIESSNALTVGTPGTTGYILASLGNSNAGQMLGLAGSNSVAANGVGGAINLSGGAATGTAKGGDVILQGGGHQAGGTPGEILFYLFSNASTNSERLRIRSTGAFAFNGATNFGTSGQVLTSSGDGPPTWTTIATGWNGGTVNSAVTINAAMPQLTLGNATNHGNITAAVSAGGSGLNIFVSGANGTTGGGGSTFIQSGNGAVNAAAGSITIQPGETSGSGSAGNTLIYGGRSVDGSNGGYISFFTSAAPNTNTERFRILNNGAWSIGSSGTAYGTSGQVLTSNGNAPPTWSAAPGTALTSTQIGYGSNSNTVTGNSSFTYDAAANGITMTGLLPRIIGGSSSGSRGTFLIRGADQPNGNNVLIRAGTADGTGGTTAHGGYLLLQSGAGSGSNAAGDVIIQTGTGGATTSSSYSSAIKFSTSNTSSTLVERFRITNTGAWSVGADGTAYGTSGQVLTSNGNAPPTWSAIPSQTITLTGDVTGSGTGSFATTLASVGTAGTYRSVTTDAKGRVTAGTNPTTLAGYGITDALDAAQKGAANGLATLGADSKIPTSQLPALAITDTFVVASEADMLALAAQTGDVAVRTDLNQTFILTGDSAATLADWQELLTPTDTVLSVNGQTGAITLTTTDIAEGTNLYYTNARASAAAPVQSVAGRTGAVTLTSSDVAEGTNQYYTDARARGAISVTGNGSYDAGTGAITINAQAAADASTLTGTTLASNVVTSSLTSVGTLTNLTVTNPIAGSITGNAATVTTNANLTGDVTSVGNATTLASVGTAGTYRSVTTDAKGRVTAGTNPTTLAGYGITDAFSTSGGAITGNVALTGNLTMTGNIVPSADITYDLGSPTMMWRDIYVGPGSIYMNGQKILENVADTIIFTADIDQNVRIETSGTGNLELQTGTGGAIIVKGPLQITAGRKILSTDGIKVEFGDDIDMSSNKIINLGTPVNAGDVATKGYVDALTTTDSTLVRTTGNQTIAGDKTFTGTTVIQGNLTVSGTTTTVNAETVTIADNILELNSNFTSGEPTEDSGIQIRRGDLGVARFIWDETADRFTIRTGAGAALDFYTGGTVTAASLVGPLTGNATTATALATSRSISITGDATWTVNFNGSANATGVLTLADVATSGTYRSVTVDTKGRITGGTNPTTLAGYGITDAVTFVNGKSGNLTLTTSDIAEGTRLYYTDERVRNAISVTGNGSYDVNSGVITINAPSAAAAGTLTGSTLASNVVTSSLTSVGTLTSLAVAGTATAEAVNINGVGLVFSSTLTTTATTANQVVATASAATYRAVKFQITVTAGSAYHYTEVSVLHNGTDTFMTETGTLSTGASLATFSSTLIGGNIQLLTTPTNAASTYKVIGTAIAI